MGSELSRGVGRVALVAAVVCWVAWGWPVIKVHAAGETIRGHAIQPAWFLAFAAFGAMMAAAMSIRLRPEWRWALLNGQVLAVAAMALILPWAGMSHFLIIVAWQAALLATPRQAVAFALAQTAVVIAALAQAISPDLCWIIAKSFAQQLVVLFLAHALRKETRTARELAAANRELHAAQAIIADNVRDAERLRISRELHDAWGHELTALGLQLEIASNVADPARAGAHVRQARGLAKTLLAKVRDVVATLREDERGGLEQALAALARSVPTPQVHVDIAPGLSVTREQAHALTRCAQEAVTNAVRHAGARNLWLRVAPDGAGVRLVARDDGRSAPVPSDAGSGLRGMRERLEYLGGRLAISGGAGDGFTVDAWLPTISPRPA